MTQIQLLMNKAAEYSEESMAYYDESDYEQGNYYRGKAHAMEEAARLLGPDYNDHDPLV